MRDPIDLYLSALARRLTMPKAERGAALTEVRAHLEERAASLQATGMPDDEAQRQAVRAFGGVRRMSRRLNAVHPQRWGVTRWIGSIVIGAAVTWALWLAGTLPAMVAYFTRYPVTSATPPPPAIDQLVHAIVQASPIGGDAFAAYLTFGWLWLIPLLALYLVIPALWGRRAERWWAPGLAYGLGAWLSVPWFVLEVVSADWGWSAEGRIIALALPLSLVASYIGWRWRPRGGLAVAPATAA